LEIFVQGAAKPLSLGNPALPAIIAAITVAAFTRSIIGTVMTGVALYWLLA
jgi:branched-subunit amino acid transport protein